MRLKRIAIAVIGCPLGLFAAAAIVHSLNLFPETVVNHASDAVISVARCHLDGSKLPAKHFGARKLDSEAVARIAAGAAAGYLVRNDDKSRAKFHPSGKFAGYEYGKFSRPYYEGLSGISYLRRSSDICLFTLHDDVGTMSFYTDKNRQLFEVTHSAQNGGIAMRKM